MGVFAIQSFWTDIVHVWDCSVFKDLFQAFDSFVILSRSEEREEAAACQSEG